MMQILAIMNCVYSMIKTADFVLRDALSICFQMEFAIKIVMLNNAGEIKGIVTVRLDAISHKLIVVISHALYKNVIMFKATKILIVMQKDKLLRNFKLFRRISIRFESFKIVKHVVKVIGIKFYWVYASMIVAIQRNMRMP